MSNQQNAYEDDIEERILQYIISNKPVTQTEIRNAFDGKVILSLRRLLKANKIEYNDDFELTSNNDTSTTSK